MGRSVETRKFFTADRKLEVKLTASDPGVLVQSNFSDRKFVTPGEQFKQWSWTVTPKIRNCVLTVLVRGTDGGDASDDYFSAPKNYDVQFNLRYWAMNGFDQNGFVLLCTLAATLTLAYFSYRLGMRAQKKKDEQAIKPKPIHRR